MNVDPKQLAIRYQPKPVKVLENGQQFCTARFSPCGKVLAAGGFAGEVCRWDVATDAFAPLPALGGHGGFIQGLAFHPDGKRLITADSWGAMRCWAHADKVAKPLWTVERAHDGWIRKVVVSPDGRLIATGGPDRVVRLWNADGGKPVQELAAGEDVYAVLFTPDGKGLVSGDLQGVLKHWDLGSGKATRQLEARAMHKVDRLNTVAGIRCLAFDPAGKMLVVGGARPLGGGFVEATPHLCIFDWVTGKAAHELALGKANEGFVTDAFFHPDGFLMGVISGPPGQGRLFYLRPGDLEPFFKQPFANPHALSLHPGGRRLVVCATNGNSAGNGAVVDKDKNYLSNFSPLHVLEFAKTTN
jgi:hypothetical protein